MSRTNLLQTWLLHEERQFWPRSPASAFQSETSSEILRPKEGLQDDRVEGVQLLHLHFLSYTALLVTIFPFAPVRMIVTVRDFPSGSITMRPVAAV